ncbi:MAG: hypothetical protein WDW38_001467 [Sanguina aurantia]
MNSTDTQAKLTASFTQQMLNETHDFFFRNYTYQFSRPLYAEALACMPHVSGLPAQLLSACRPAGRPVGRHPVPLSQAPRLRVTLSRACAQTFGEWGASDLKLFGERVALLALDCRSERSRESIMKLGSWALVQQRLLALPPSVQHLVVLSPGPVVYPLLALQQSALAHFTGCGHTRATIVGLQQKTGLAEQLMGTFGMGFAVQDESPDTWAAGAHAAEKLMLVRMMQDLCQARGFRVSFLSGGSQVAAVCKLRSSSRTLNRNDFRLMPQIIAPSLNNNPPQQAVIHALQAAPPTRRLDESTQESLHPFFSKQQNFKGQRGWLVVSQRPSGSGAGNAALVFQHRLEDPSAKYQRPQTHEYEVPLLELQASDILRGAQRSPLPAQPGGQPALLLTPQSAPEASQSVHSSNSYLPILSAIPQQQQQQQQSSDTQPLQQQANNTQQQQQQQQQQQRQPSNQGHQQQQSGSGQQRRPSNEQLQRSEQTQQQPNNTQPMSQGGQSRPPLQLQPAVAQQGAQVQTDARLKQPQQQQLPQQQQQPQPSSPPPDFQRQSRPQQQSMHQQPRLSQQRQQTYDKAGQLPPSFHAQPAPSAALAQQQGRQSAPVQQYELVGPSHQLQAASGHMQQGSSVVQGGDFGLAADVQLTHTQAQGVGLMA